MERAPQRLERDHTQTSRRSQVTAFLRLSLLAAWLFPSTLSALADGAVFNEVRYQAVVEIPNQQALIRFANNTERLVIETSFSAEGTNFAWVVPLPSPPIITQVSEDFFQNLRKSFEPQLMHNVHHYYAGVLLFVIFCFLAMRSLRDDVAWTHDLPWCVVALFIAGTVTHSAVAGFAVLGASLILRIFPRTPKNITMCLLVVTALSGYVIMLSGEVSFMGSIGQEAGYHPEEGVRVLSVQHVGVFESTTLQGRDPSALQRWLEKNGYKLPASTQPAVRHYCESGWVFVASKVDRTNTGSIVAMHPLAFTFATPTPIYPMALTAAAVTKECTVDLYVIGESRAAAKHFSVTRCDSLAGQLKPGGEHSYTWLTIDDGSSEPLGDDKVGTKLTASLTPKQMASDIEIKWRPFWKTGAYVYSDAGAAIVALNGALPVGLIGWLLIGASASTTDRLVTEKDISRWRTYLVVAILLLSIAAFFWLPKVAIVAVG